MYRSVLLAVRLELLGLYTMNNVDITMPWCCLAGTPEAVDTTESRSSLISYHPQRHRVFGLLITYCTRATKLRTVQ